MSINEARLIRYLKTGRVMHSWRRMAQIYYPIDQDWHGNQLAGKELCKDAAEVLGENYMDWEDTEISDFDSWAAKNPPKKTDLVALKKKIKGTQKS